MLSKTKKLTKGGDNIGRIVIMEFKAQDSTAFDDMLAFVKQHPDFEKLEISYEPTLSLSGLEINLSRRRVINNGQEIELTVKANEKAFTNQKKVLAKRGVACPIFFCPTCGRRLGFTSRETGYRCMQAHISGLSGCAESKMDRKEAEETVLDVARNMAQFISENLEKKKREWHKTILKEENIATLKSEKKRLSSRKMKLYSDYRSEVLDKEGYMEELEKTTSRILEITLQIAELENEIAVAKKKCDEATEKEMEVNEIAALQDFDKIQLSKIIEKVFIYEPGRMEISWKMDDIFYKEEKA